MKNNTAVVILNWNGRQFLEIFLPKLVERTFDATIYVADNGSTDDSLSYLSSAFPQVELIKLDANYGFTGGYNRALAQIDAKYYVLLNSDIEVSENWLAPLIEVLERDDIVAAVQPKILSFAEKNRFEYAGASGGFIDCLGYPFCRGRIIGEQTEFDNGQYDDSREIFWASGAAFVVRADVYRKMGGLDENFFAHMEEIDLCWRMKRAGYKIMVEPRSVVHHVGGGTLPVWSPQKTYLNFRNNIAMLYKNLSTLNFVMVYFVRLGTDFLRFASYAVPMRWKFASAIYRGHRDFWRMRGKLDRSKELNNGKVGQIYRGSIVLRQLVRGKVFGKMMTIMFALMLAVSCGNASVSANNGDTKAKTVTTPKIKAEVVTKYSHDRAAYTQGLLYRGGKLYESTGEYGHSSLRVVDLATGKVEKKYEIGDEYFAEGLELVGGKLYQLTWQEGVAFVYDFKTLSKVGEFKYRGEGWGLATDGKELYMSDGTNVVTVRDTANFNETRRFAVSDSNGPVDMLNEMEWIDGKLWANIYLTNLIAVINPADGKIERYIDCADLAVGIGNIQNADVLNGIAYDRDGGKVYVTGKNWDTLFEIKK